jgi:CheY-like chemotaxis protein
VAAEVRVVADYMRLKQSLLNLLSNAVKYNREGGSVQIEVAAAGADRWRIGVTDTGRGIPAHQRAELFQPFHRLGGNVSEVEGTGIGLALTQSLVHAMGGEIGFASESGQGSTFWIELPAARDAAPLAARAAAVAAAEPADVDGERKLLLYIEDNPANVLLMEQIARRMALRFAHAADGASGLSLARAEHPDLIVMDIHLPDISGYEALARLKQDPRTRAIPVMALTANAMRKDVARGIAAGFARYLTKPFEVDELMSAVGEVIEAPR